MHNTQCNVCDRTFACSSNRLRHERKFHADSKIYDCTLCQRQFSSGQALNDHHEWFHRTREPVQVGGGNPLLRKPPQPFVPIVPVEPEDESEAGSENQDEEESMDDEEIDSRSDDSSSKGDESEESEDEEESDQSPDYWRNVIAQAYDELEIDYEDPKDALREPYLSELIDAIRKQFDRHFQFVHYMENDDAVYESIAHRENYYNNQEDLFDDATELAWHDLRFRVRNEIEQNLDLFDEQKRVVEEEEDEEDAEELDPAWMQCYEIIWLIDICA